MNSRGQFVSSVECLQTGIAGGVGQVHLYKHTNKDVFLIKEGLRGISAHK